MLSATNQAQKDKYHVTSLSYRVKDTGDHARAKDRVVVARSWGARPPQGTGTCDCSSLFGLQNFPELFTIIILPTEAGTRLAG